MGVMGVSRRAGLLMVALSGLLLVGAAVAWACTPSAEIRVNPSNAPADGRVTVSGASFPDGGPVEIRWNAVDGPLLAEAKGSHFSTEVTIPQSAEQGTYTIVAIGYRTDVHRQIDEPEGKAAHPVEVQASETPDAEETQKSEGAGDGQATEPSRAYADGGSNDAESNADQSGGTVADTSSTMEGDRESQGHSSQASTGTNEDSAEASQQERGTPQQPVEEVETTQVASTNQGASQSQPSQPESTVEPGERENVGKQRRGLSQDRDRETALGEWRLGAVEHPDGQQSGQGRPMSNSATNDLWSGMQGPVDSAALRGESQGGQPEGLKDAPGQTKPLAVGVGLLGAGLLMLVSAAIMLLHRRRGLVYAAKRWSP